MISIAIYDDNQTYIDEIQQLIQDYLIETSTMAKVSVFNKAEDLILAPASFDIYIMDTDSCEDIKKLSAKIDQIDPNSYFIFIGEDPNLAYTAYQVHADYYLLKPIDKEKFNELLAWVRKNLKEDSFIIRTPMGDRRVKTNELNYVNIVKRCLSYHLKDGTMFDGQTLRSSFESAITPLNFHPSFIFLAPSLLINLSQIKILDKDNLTFENGDVLFFPKKAHDIIYEKWKTYNKIL